MTESLLGGISSAVLLQGFTGEGKIFGCQDVDECEADPYLCEDPLVCINNSGGYTCE